MEKFENIIFDLGGVLLNVDYNLTRQAFEKLGVVDFDSMYSQANADKLFQNLEMGKISDLNFYKELNRCTGLDLSPSEIDTAWNAMLLDFREKSLVFLEEISEKYNLFLLSNTNYIHMAAFKKIFHSCPRTRTFEAYFNKAFYSCEIGFRKPDADCYEYVLSTLAIKPEKTLFIDDSEHNIEGAIKAGLQTIYLTEGNVIEELGL